MLISFNEFVNEASFSRMLSQIQLREFAILSAYRYENDTKTNKKLNQELMKDLNAAKMGPYQLFGYWQECQNKNVSYKNCPKSDLIDSEEDSFLVIKPDELPIDEFKSKILKYIIKYHQDAALICIDKMVRLMFQDGTTEAKGNKVGLNQIQQAYSRMKNKPDLPFVIRL